MATRALALAADLGCRPHGVNLLSSVGGLAGTGVASARKMALYLQGRPPDACEQS